MNWSSWSEFAAMGGYALYVWGSFGVTALVMLAEVLSLQARRKALRRAARDAYGHAEFGGSPHEA